MEHDLDAVGEIGDVTGDVEEPGLRRRDAGKIGVLEELDNDLVERVGRRTEVLNDRLHRSVKR